VNDPHIAGAREMFVEISTPAGKNMKAVACPIKFSDTKATIRQGPPKLGEHNDEVLRELMGMDDAAIEQVKKNGALG
jgi:formyl-CoA transferase